MIVLIVNHVLQHIAGCRLVATLALDLGCARGSLTEYCYTHAHSFSQVDQKTETATLDVSLGIYLLWVGVLYFVSRCFIYS